MTTDVVVLTDHRKRSKERLRKALTEEKSMLRNTAFLRCGQHLRLEEFDDVIQELFTEGFLTITLSTYGKQRLVLVNEQRSV